MLKPDKLSELMHFRLPELKILTKPPQVSGRERQRRQAGRGRFSNQLVSQRTMMSSSWGSLSKIPINLCNSFNSDPVY